jgi:HPt (histidine-containing phosphotransfer) domain-containing protein
MPESSRNPTPPSGETAAEPTSGGRESGSIVSTLAEHPTLNVLVRGFVERLPKRIEELRAAFAGADFEVLANLAHGLRGAGGTYGFKQLTDAAGVLERCVRDGAEPSEIGAALARLGDVSDRVSE